MEVFLLKKKEMNNKGGWDIQNTDSGLSTLFYFQNLSLLLGETCWIKEHFFVYDTLLLNPSTWWCWQPYSICIILNTFQKELVESKN